MYGVKNHVYLVSILDIFCLYIINFVIYVTDLQASYKGDARCKESRYIHAQHGPETLQTSTTRSSVCHQESRRHLWTTWSVPPSLPPSLPLYNLSIFIEQLIQLCIFSKVYKHYNIYLLRDRLSFASPLFSSKVTFMTLAHYISCLMILCKLSDPPYISFMGSFGIKIQQHLFLIIF